MSSCSMMGGGFGGIFVGAIVLTSPVWLAAYGLIYACQQASRGVGALSTGVSSLVRQGLFNPQKNPQPIAEIEQENNKAPSLAK